MNAPNGRNAFQRLRGWWFSPPRRGMQRLINPWEYRHLRVFGYLRVAGGSVLAVCCALTLAFGGANWQAYGWASFFLVLAALNLAGGYWYLTIARAAPPRI